MRSLGVSNFPDRPTAARSTSTSHTAERTVRRHRRVSIGTHRSTSGLIRLADSSSQVACQHPRKPSGPFSGLEVRAVHAQPRRAQLPRSQSEQSQRGAPRRRRYELPAVPERARRCVNPSSLELAASDARNWLHRHSVAQMQRPRFHGSPNPARLSRRPVRVRARSSSQRGQAVAGGSILWPGTPGYVPLDGRDDVEGPERHEGAWLAVLRSGRLVDVLRNATQEEKATLANRKADGLLPGPGGVRTTSAVRIYLA